MWKVIIFILISIGSAMALQGLIYGLVIVACLAMMFTPFLMFKRK